MSAAGTKTISCVGDSITAGGWPQIMQANLNAKYGAGVYNVRRMVVVERILFIVLLLLSKRRRGWLPWCGGGGGCRAAAAWMCLYCPQDRGCGHVPNALRATGPTLHVVFLWFSNAFC